MLESFLSSEIWSNIVLGLRYLYMFMPIWLPTVFLVMAFNAWLYYRRSVFWSKQNPVLLEIKIPKEITKSPLAMEIVLNALHQTGGESTWIDRIWKGQTRAWFSLEIVSLGGKIHFYIWTWSKFRNILEAQIYSQYPGVEIYEVKDYSIPFYYHPEKNDIWATEFALTAADPFPIKTYIDYGLDKDPKEDIKIDPMTAMIEFLGSITDGQNIWIQILIRAHKKRRFMDVFGEKEDYWKDEAKAQIKKIIESTKIEGRIPTKGEAEMIAALERSVTKFPFDCGIRAIHISDKDRFNSVLNGGITGCLKQYSSLNLNGFKPSGWFTIFDYPWQEWFNAKEKLKPRVLEEYKMRRYFYSPWMGRKFYSKPFVLNTEELATIYHFPGAVASTPTFERIPSRKAEAPSNLPL